MGGSGKDRRCYWCNRTETADIAFRTVALDARTIVDACEECAEDCFDESDRIANERMHPSEL